MDKFTDKANQIIQKLDEARLIYKSDGSPVTGEEEEMLGNNPGMPEEEDYEKIPEEDYEGPAYRPGGSQPAFLTKAQVDALNVAGQITGGEAQGGVFARDNKKKIGAALNRLYGKVADQVNKVAQGM